MAGSYGCSYLAANGVITASPAWRRSPSPPRPRRSPCWNRARCPLPTRGKSPQGMPRCSAESGLRHSRFIPRSSSLRARGEPVLLRSIQIGWPSITSIRAFTSDAVTITGRRRGEGMTGRSPSCRLAPINHCALEPRSTCHIWIRSAVVSVVSLASAFGTSPVLSTCVVGVSHASNSRSRLSQISQPAPATMASTISAAIFQPCALRPWMVMSARLSRPTPAPQRGAVSPR